MNRQTVHRFIGYAVLFAIGITLYSWGARDLAQESRTSSPNVGGISITTVVNSAITVLNSADMSD